MSPQEEHKKTDKFTLFVYCNFLVLLSTTVCNQIINKQNVNIADETDYSFLSRYHYVADKSFIQPSLKLYKIKELFKKTILNSSLNYHVYWDTLYHIIYLKLFLSHHCSQCKCKLHNFKTYVYLNHSSSHLQTNKHTKLKTVYVSLEFKF